MNGSAWTPRQIERLLVASEAIAAAARHYHAQSSIARGPARADSEALELRATLEQILLQLNEWVQAPGHISPGALLPLVAEVRRAVGSREKAA